MNLIEGFSRIGEENAFAVLARAQKLANSGKDVINLGIGQPDFQTPTHIVEAAIQALKNGEHGYTPATGIPALTNAVAEELSQRYNANVAAASVAIVPGGKITMFAAILMFGKPGVEILYPDPGFPIYRSMIEFTGATPIPIPIRESNGFAFSADETLNLINENTRLLIVNSPANPCGGVTPKAEIDALVAGLDSHPNVAILSDEIYDRMVYDDERHTSLLTYPSIQDRLILLNGWSKTYAMTGWRLGYSVWPDQCIDAIRKLAVNAWSCVNTPSQHAALAAITGPQDSVTQMVETFDERRRFAVEALNQIPEISCITPKGAFYAFPNIKDTGWGSKALATQLLETAGIATIGGPDFGTLGEGYLRVSYANSLPNIERAIERIGKFLNEHEPA